MPVHPHPPAPGGATAAAGPHRWLAATRGWLLATTGHQAWTGVEDGWLGGSVPMWWSHADAATHRAWLQAAGLRVTAEEFVPEGDGGHALFWAPLARTQPGSHRGPDWLLLG